MGIGDGGLKHDAHGEGEARSEKAALQWTPIISSRRPLAGEHDAGGAIVDEAHPSSRNPKS